MLSNKSNKLVYNETKSSQRGGIQLDNRQVAGSCSKHQLVEGRAGSETIYRTAKASNNAGRNEKVLPIEEREELESRRINFIWNSTRKVNEIEDSANTAKKLKSQLTKTIRKL